MPLIGVFTIVLNTFLTSPPPLATELFLFPFLPPHPHSTYRNLILPPSLTFMVPPSRTFTYTDMLLVGGRELGKVLKPPQTYCSHKVGLEDKPDLATGRTNTSERTVVRSLPIFQEENLEALKLEIIRGWST